MEGLTNYAPMTGLLRERGVFDRAPFVLIDVGCAGGIDAAWRAFGPSLVARGYDPDVAACEEAQAREPFDNVLYQARYVGLGETHPFVEKRRADALRWPQTNIWGRITAGYLAGRGQPGAPRRMADPSTLIGVDAIVRTENLPTVDFLKVDVDGPDLEVLESARDVFGDSNVLGVGLEVNWFGTSSPTEHTFHNTDRFLREQGFALFGLTFRRYSRIDMPAPFEFEFFAQTRFGQPYQGDAIYIRDLAADHLAAQAASYSPDKLIKLACIYELVGLPDCAAEVLNRFKSRLSFGDPDHLLDALTPPLLGEQLPYREYIARFNRAPDLFLPSAAAQSDLSTPSTPKLAHNPLVADSVFVHGGSERGEKRIRRRLSRVRSHRGRRPNRLVLAAQLRSALLRRAPDGIIHAVAGALARGQPLALDPAWRFRFPEEDEPQLTLLKRDIWSHYRDNAIDTPVIFRWYDGLRVRIHLGNDLSLCLYVLGAFEPNQFVFLSRVLAPGMVIVDGGANEGLYTLYAARRVGPDGYVLAVEPSAREFARLEANLSLNRFGNALTVNAALGSQVGEARLAVAEPRHAGMNAIDSRRSGHFTADWVEAQQTVELQTIDKLVVRAGVERLDLIKLDIEGSEVDALDGARTAISRYRPKILLEVEEERLSSQGRTTEELVQVLSELSYDLWVFDGMSGELRRAELPEDLDGNAVALPRGSRPPMLG